MAQSRFKAETVANRDIIIDESLYHGVGFIAATNRHIACGLEGVVTSVN